MYYITFFVCLFSITFTVRSYSKIKDEWKIMPYTLAIVVQAIALALLLQEIIENL